jgi:hypothetical protein
MDLNRIEPGHHPIPDKDTFPDRTGPKEPTMRRFGFLIVALAAIVMFFSPGQRERTGPSEAPPSDELTETAPGNGDVIDTASEDAKEPAATVERVGDVPAPSPVKAAADTAPHVEQVRNDAPPGPPNDSPPRIPVHLLPFFPQNGSAADTTKEEPLSEADLATAAQQELTRLGCYEGKIDGKWGRQSRAAADNFNEHTGGNLESGDPSETLLAALRAAPDQACELRAATLPGQSVTSVEADVAPPKTEEKAPPLLTERDLAYLPPWMREEKLARAKAAAEASGDSAATPGEPNAGPASAEPAPKPAKPRQRHRQWRYVDDRPQRSRDRSFSVEGWPGSRR